MHFRTAHLIAGIAPERFEPLFFDEALNVRLCQALGLDRTLLALQQEGGQLRRTVRIRPERQVPAALRAVIGQTAVEYTENMVWQQGSRRGDWTIVPNVFTDRVTAVGWVQFDAHPEGTLRVVEGEVGVRLLGLGKVAELFIVQDIERSFADAARLTPSLLPAGPTP